MVCCMGGAAVVHMLMISVGGMREVGVCMAILAQGHGCAWPHWSLMNLLQDFIHDEAEPHIRMCIYRHFPLWCVGWRCSGSYARDTGCMVG